MQTGDVSRQLSGWRRQNYGGRIQRTDGRALWTQLCQLRGLQLPWERNDDQPITRRVFERYGEGGAAMSRIDGSPPIP